MAKSLKSGHALEFLRKGILLLVNTIVLFLVIFMIIHSCRACYSLCYEIYGPVVVEKSPGTDKKFSVAESDTMYKVAGNLYEEGLIVNKYSFYIRTKLMDKDEIKLKSGEYMLNTSMNYEEILDLLTQSD